MEVKNKDIYKRIFWAVLSPALAVLTILALFRQSESISFCDLLETAISANKIWFFVLLYLSLGGSVKQAPMLFSKQCLSTIGYNFVPIPGAMGIADYLMLDGFSGILGESGAFSLEMLTRGLTFYICVTANGIITLIGYLIKRRKKLEHDSEVSNET